MSQITQKVINDHPAITVRPDKCTNCMECVEFCAYEAIEVKVVDLESAKIEIIFNQNCVACGDCVDVCPTGALTKKILNVREVQTTCPYCSVGCQLTIKVAGNTIADVTADHKLPPNYGRLCVKGRFGFDFINHLDRLKTPLIRRTKGGELEPVSWEEALDFATTKMKEILEKYGPDAIGGYASARCTIEDNYSFQKFFRTVIGTNNIDCCARY